MFAGKLPVVLVVFFEHNETLQFTGKQNGAQTEMSDMLAGLVGRITELLFSYCSVNATLLLKRNVKPFESRQYAGSHLLIGPCVHDSAIWDFHRCENGLSSALINFQKYR